MISLNSLRDLLILMPASFIQSSQFMITATVPFVVSGLITAWMLNLRDSKALLSVTVSDYGIYCWLLQSQIFF